MGRVSFGCDSSADGKMHIPIIAIENAGVEITFRADKHLPTEDMAREFVMECARILSGERGMKNFVYDRNGNADAKT